jgi:hypothetical protein
MVPKIDKINFLVKIDFYKTAYTFTDLKTQTLTCFSHLWLLLDFFLNGGNIQDGVWWQCSSIS